MHTHLEYCKTGRQELHDVFEASDDADGYDVECRCYDVLKQMYTVQTESPCRLACRAPSVRSPERALGCHLCTLFSRRSEPPCFGTSREILLGLSTSPLVF